MKAAFQTVGADLPPCWPLTPVEVARLSSPPAMTLWQELQDTVPVAESLGSKNSCLPSLILAGVIGLSAGTGGFAGRGSKIPAQAADANRVTKNVPTINLEFFIKTR